MRIRSRPLLALSVLLLASAGAMLAVQPGAEDPARLLTHEPGDRVLVEGDMRPLTHLESQRLVRLGLPPNATMALVDGDSPVLVAAVVDGRAPFAPGPWPATVLAVTPEPPVVVLAIEA